MSSVKSDVISMAEATSIAKKACDNCESIQVNCYTLEPYSEDKLGFLGSHQKLEITIERQPSLSKEERLNFFVKAVPTESQEQTDFVKQRKVFEHESAFFRSVMPHLLEATSLGDIEAWAPICYLARDDAIVLEDVRAKKFAMRDVKLFEGESLLSVVRTLARLHAASILAEQKLGKRFIDYCPAACSEQLFVDFPQVLEWSEFLFADTIEKVAERSGRRFKNVKSAVRKAYSYFTTYKSKHRVINHGDAWPNNIMLDDSEPPKCILVDYQVARYASGMFDLAQMMYLSTRREKRMKVERLVVETYWKEVCLTLEKCDPTVDKPKLADLVQEYEDAKLPALLTAVSYLPLILIKKDVFKEYDPETLFKKLVFRRNNECVLEMMDKDREYSDRVQETALEFLDVSERLSYDKDE